MYDNYLIYLLNVFYTIQRIIPKKPNLPNFSLHLNINLVAKFFHKSEKLFLIDVHLLN